MATPKFLLLAWCVVPSLVIGQTTTVTQLGSSGKFRVSNENGANDPNTVTIEPDSVAEIWTVGAYDPTHQNPTLANQDFTISGPVSTTIGNGVAASQITFTSTLVEKGGSSTYGILRFDTYIMETEGTVTTDTETFNVQPGDVKFNIDLSSWTFATNTEYVEVTLVIKGKGDKITKTEENTFNLGGNVPLILSGRVVVDGVETSMPAGFPTYRQNGNKYTFFFRIPRFTTSATYDPVLKYSNAGDCVFNAASMYQGIAKVGSFLRGAFSGEP